MSDYLEILKEWERQTANQAIYDHLDTLLPSYGFKRLNTGGNRDHWASRLKIDLTEPRQANAEKTVVYPDDFRLREQGEWDSPVWVIDALMEDWNLSSIYEVYKTVAQRLGLEMPSPSGETVMIHNTQERRIQKLRRFLKDYFTEQLFYNSRNGRRMMALDYLKETRGFSEEQIKALGLGFVPSWDMVESFVLNPRTGFTAEELQLACNVKNEEGLTSVGSLHIISIPYICGGEIKGFLFRAVDANARAKYKASTGLDRKSSFFNIQNNHDPKELIVVEGELDALTATAAGIKDVVAIGGSDISGERRSQVYDALNKNTVRIILCLDLDTDRNGEPNAGKRFKSIRKSIHTIHDVNADFTEIYVAELPYPTDPDEFIRREGTEAFSALIHNAKPWWKYISDFFDQKS